MLLTRLQSWLNSMSAMRQRPGRKSHGQPTRRRSQPLLLEALEDRTVPTVLFAPQFGTEFPAQDGGQRINSPNVYVVLWGQSWGGVNTSNAIQVYGGITGVLFSHYLDGLSQYGVTTNATLRGFIFDNTPDPNSGFSQNSMSTEIERLITANQLPDPANTPNMIVDMVTARNITSGLTGAAGYNSERANGDNSFRYGYIWNGTNFGSLSLKDSLSLIFSHELAEAMISPGGKGFEVTSGIQPGKNGTHWVLTPPESSPNQIGDFEGNSYSYRLGDGTLVQPYWSAADNQWKVTDGNSQTINVIPNWTKNADGTQKNFVNYDVTVKGGQLPQADYLSVNDQFSGDQPSVLAIVLNNELFQLDSTSSNGNPQLGTLTATISSGVVHINASPMMTGITVNGKGGTEVDVAATKASVSINGARTVNVGNGWDSLQGIKNSVDIAGNSLTNLTIIDTKAANPVEYDVFSNFLLAKPSFVSIGYTNLHTLTINGGGFGNDFEVAGTPAAFTTLNTGAGNNTVNVHATSGPLFVDGHGGKDTVRIGFGGSTQQIGGPLNVTNTGGASAVVVDDSADSIARTVIVYGKVPALGRPVTIISGLTPGGDITLRSGDVSSLNIYAGAGGNTFRIHDTPFGPSSAPAVTTISTGGATTWSPWTARPGHWSSMARADWTPSTLARATCTTSATR
jgi:hypothetical protein